MRRTSLEQLVAQDQQRDIGRPDDGERVVPGRGSHADDGRRDDAPGLEEQLAGRGFDSAGADVGTELDVTGMRVGDTRRLVADVEARTTA